MLATPADIYTNATYWRTPRYSAIGKYLKKDHGLKTIGDLTNSFSVLKKRNGKLDCLICEMFFIKNIRPSLKTQSDSIRAKLYLICHFLHANITFYRLVHMYILSCQLLFFFHLKMMTWSQGKVVSNSFRLFLSLDVYIGPRFTCFGCFFYCQLIF